MNKEERQALIEEKQNEIRRLRNEITDLRASSIRALATQKIIWMVRKDKETGDVYVRSGNTDYSDIWNTIRLLSTKIHMEKGQNDWWGGDYYEVPNKKVKQENMTEEQKKQSAKFADEVIHIFNKYILEVNNPFVLNGESYKVVFEEEDKDE